MRPALLTAVLALLVLSPGCLTASVPAPTYEAAAEALRADVTGPSRLLAAAALLHARQGQFPATPYDLLGSLPGGSTGARAVRLSALRLEATGDALAIHYTTAPSASDPTYIDGQVRLVPTGTGTYTATFDLTRTDMRTGERLPFTVQDALEVRHVAGTLRLDADALQTVNVATLAAPYSPDQGLTITFQRTGSDEPVQTVTLR